MAEDKQRSEEEIAKRRDDTIKRMIAMPAKTLKGAPKRPTKSTKKRR
jgi:hypothetical protein